MPYGYNKMSLHRKTERALVRQQQATRTRWSFVLHSIFTCKRHLKTWPVYTKILHLWWLDLSLAADWCQNMKTVLVFFFSYYSTLPYKQFWIVVYFGSNFFFPMFINFWIIHSLCDPSINLDMTDNSVHF